MIELIHGDCLEEMKKIPDGSIDLVLTDPPYGTTACKWDSVIPLGNRCGKHLKRIIKHNGAIMMFCAEPFASVLRVSNLRNYKYDFVWIKEQGTGFLNSKKQPLRNNESNCRFLRKTTKTDRPAYMRKGFKPYMA